MVTTIDQSMARPSTPGFPCRQIHGASLHLAFPRVDRSALCLWTGWIVQRSAFQRFANCETERSAHPVGRFIPDLKLRRRVEAFLFFFYIEPGDARVRIEPRSHQDLVKYYTLARGRAMTILRVARRECVAALGCVAAWPMVARGQPSKKTRRLIYLHGLAENDPEVQAQIVAFRQALVGLGWIEGLNITINHRFAGGDPARAQAIASDAVDSAPDLIVINSTAVLAAIKRATTSIPGVFAAVNDPVGQGLIASLARPGGNITGFTFIEYPIIGKWLEMLKEVAPGMDRVALIFNPQTVPSYVSYLRSFESEPRSIAVEVAAAPVRTENEIEAAVAALAGKLGGGLIVAPDPFINVHRALIMALAQRYRLPAVYSYRQFVPEGALMSYGPDSIDSVRRSASYVDCIFKGANPADLPQPQDRQNAGPYRTAYAAALRRRGDRVRAQAAPKLADWNARYEDNRMSDAIKAEINSANSGTALHARNAE
jgi:putative ABC transport system substrate-binding protein